MAAYLAHSKGPWKDHKYKEKKDGKYIYDDDQGRKAYSNPIREAALSKGIVTQEQLDKVQEAVDKVRDLKPKPKPDAKTQTAVKAALWVVGKIYGSNSTSKG